MNNSLTRRPAIDPAVADILEGAERAIHRFDLRAEVTRAVSPLLPQIKRDAKLANQRRRIKQALGGFAVVSHWVPYLVFSVFVGALNDRLDSRRLIQAGAVLFAIGVAGVDPAYMGIGPMVAIPKALERAGLELDQIDLIELNEAFASQVLACDRDLHFDRERLNVNGGAIALGHPLGCTGAKLTSTLLYELGRRGKKWGIVSMCIGGGMGAAGLFERI